MHYHGQTERRYSHQGSCTNIIERNYVRRTTKIKTYYEACLFDLTAHSHTFVGNLDDFGIMKTKIYPVVSYLDKLYVSPF